ncbi:MAG: FAD-binding oxidoreductase [Actinobacteria bacterium]|nr:FAD-binding oxidoreductase [Actinomycetota bacterium]
MGASTAFHLAEAGVNVTLLERDSLASGSTSKAAGGVRANFSDELNIALGLRSLVAFENFKVRPGQDIDLHQVGYLFILTKPEDVELFEGSVKLQNSLGVKSRMLTPQEAQEISPLLNIDGVLAAAYSPRDGHCTPESVVLGYATGARKHGASIHTGVEVTGIVHDGSTISAVETTAGRIETSTVINCAGAWSPQIGAMVGLDIPVVPYRREILITEPIADLPDHFPMTIDFSSSFYFHREGPGLLTGFSDQSVEAGFSLNRDDSFAEKLGELAMVRAPRVLDAGIRSGWAGLYEVTPDHNALLGEWKKMSRFLYATGFSGHGFLQGPAIGEIFRDLYLGKTPFVDITPLNIERFASGNLRPERNVV